MLVEALLLASILSSATDFAGINQDYIWTEPELREPLMEKTAELGIPWVRIPIRWVTVEPEKGKWDFSVPDGVVRGLRSRGVEILAILMSIPTWANGKKPGEVEGWHDCYPPDSLEDWGNYVRETVKRYRGEIRYWEIWNEQNGIDFFRPMPDAEKYVELLKVAYQACKEADPECTVVLGGLQMDGVIANPWSPVKVEHFLQGIYDAGGAPFFDIANIHPYILSSDPIGKMTDQIERTLGVMERNGDGGKPLWITEVGCGTASDPDGALQADLLRNSYAEARRYPAVEKVFWFCLRDYPRDIVGPESTMGILTKDLGEKPSAKAMREVIRSLR